MPRFKFRIIVETITKRTYKGDWEVRDINFVNETMQVLERLKQVEFLKMKVNGNFMSFNPAHIVSVKAVVQEITNEKLPC